VNLKSCFYQKDEQNYLKFYIDLDIVLGHEESLSKNEYLKNLHLKYSLFFKLLRNRHLSKGVRKWQKLN